MRLAMLCVAGLALGLQAVLAEIPVSFDHGKRIWLCQQTGSLHAACDQSEGSDVTRMALYNAIVTSTAVQVLAVAILFTVRTLSLHVVCCLCANMIIHNPYALANVNLAN